MKIILVWPTTKGARSGNGTTARRWSGMLRALGHDVQVQHEYQGEPVDLLIALHAWRSRDAVLTFRQHWPHKPLIVALTGTDLYGFQYSHPQETGQSIQLADVLIGLHDRVPLALPEAARPKVRIVYQSATPRERQPPEKGVFEICVVGHLREEKDPLRAAWAVRELPEKSRIRVTQVGRAMSPEWEREAREEMARNPRFKWRGEVDETAVADLMARSRLMVISSRMEGGANVVSEACRAGLPVIASYIDGNIGLLGEDYGGYYPVGDTASLHDLLCMIEHEPFMLDKLRRQCLARAELFRPETEQAALAEALDAAAHAVRA
ncbi:selenoneine biosynthesis selenosugar synthase SenB [Marinobacteraceae bacterium S3BR75-40.1]